MTNDMSHEATGFPLKYCAAFMAIQMVLLLVVVAATFFLKVDLGSGMNVVVIIVSAIYPAAMFVKDHGRAPEKRDRRLFGIGGLIASYLCSFISIALIFLILTPEQAEQFKAIYAQIPVAMMAGVMLLVSVLYYFLIAWTYTLYARQYLKARLKRQD